jgi:hypothetical protein
LLPLTTSESELSDGGADGRTAAPAGAALVAPSRIRLAALVCAQAAIRIASRRALNRYWQSFIPDKLVPNANNTLFAVTMNDPNPKGRSAAYSVLAALFDGSRSFLMSADDSSHGKAFTSLSSQLGTMLALTHDAILHALASETSPVTLAHGLKVGTRAASL